MSKNIKEIGKELLGKSLNSFHRKTGLTQLERNNEMQDGILDGILSQVDDAYIEKTEQSNAIHLDGSGDGVVVLDSIEGNTMVNLLKDLRAGGAWVDNGNKFSLNITTGSGQPLIIGNLNYELKKDTVYTVILNVVEYTTGIPHVCFMNKENNKLASTTEATTSSIGLKKFKLITKSDIDSSILRILPRNGIDNTYSIGKDILILEGDWTNKEIPASYFEGLQSSFKEKINDEGKYEIEILIKNKNLFDGEMEDGAYGANGVELTHPTFRNKNKFILVEPNTKYNLQCINSGEKPVIHEYDENKTFIRYGYDISRYGTHERTKYINFRTQTNTLDYKFQLEKGDVLSEYIPHKTNKIKLLLDEPLRSISTMKDKLCIKDGKIKVERNLGQVTFSGNEDWQDSWQYSNETDFLTRYYTLTFDEFGRYAKHPRRNVKTKCLSDNFSEVYCFSSVWGKQYNYIAIHGDSNPYYFQVSILKSMVGNDLTKQGFKNWIKNNGLSVVYPLAEPYYEEVLNEYGEPIILEGYENGTLYIDSTVIPTTTVRYTPKMESLNTLKKISNNNTLLSNDVNDTIIPYMMEVDLMIMEKEMALMSHKNIRKMEVLDMTSMQKRTQDMLTRLIKGKTLTEQECKTRVTTYLNAGKITDEQAEELMLLIDEVYA